MIVYFAWKTFIKEKHNSFLDEIDLFISFILFILMTPFMVILDIILLPIEILYCIYRKI